MVELPPCQNYGWKADVKTCEVVGFDCGQARRGREPRSVAVKRNDVENVLQKRSRHGIKKRTEATENILKIERLNNIFRMCLEPDNLGERLSLKSPKNFVVQYFTVSRKQSVKVCSVSGCPTAEQDLRTQESRLQPACPERPCCKHSRAENTQYSNPCSNSSKRAGNPSRDDRRPCSSSGRGRSCIAGSSKSRKNTPQQTDPELSWQEKCSNFIISLPVTLSDKLFGPRTTYSELNDCKRTIFDDSSKLNRSQPAPKDSPRLGSRDQSFKQSAEPQNSSPANLGCHKNIGSDRDCLGKARQADPCHARTLHAVQKDVPLESGFKCGAKKSASSSVPEQNKRGKTSPSFLNWATILSDKFFGPPSEKVIDDEVAGAKAGDTDLNGPDVVSLAGSPTAPKKGRLLRKKYTISKTPEAMEETLCFNILGKEQLTETRTKLQSKACVKFTSDNLQKLETVRKRDAKTVKRSQTGRFHASGRSVKSRGNYSGSNSRKTVKLEKETSTEHIFLSNLIMKLLNRHKDDEDATDGNKCNRKTAGKRNTVSRKYATTSIHEHRNKPVKVEDGRKNGEDLCSLEQNVSLDCRVPGKYEPERENTSDYSSGRKDASAEGSTRTCLCEENLENVGDSSEKGTRVRTHDCTNRLEQKSSDMQGDYQDCNGCGSTKAKDLVKSGVLEVIDESCRTEPGGLRFLHGRKRDAKLPAREKYCKRISSPNKFICKARRSYRIENNDSHLVCRGCFEESGTTEAGICRLIEESKASTPENYGKQSTAGKVCERLIVIGNEISDPEGGSSREGPRRTFVIAGENICVKMFNDRETFTGDLSVSSEFLRGEKPCREIPRSTTVKNIEKLKNRLPPSQKPGKIRIANRIRNSEISDLGQESGGCYPPPKSPPSEKNGSGSIQKQPENTTEMRIGCEERVGLLCEDNAHGVRPGGIPRDDGVLGKVFPPLCRETSEERENKVCGSESYPCKASVGSEIEEALTVSKPPKDGECSDSTSGVTGDNRQSLNRYSGRSERLDGGELNIDNPEGGGSCTKSSGKDLSVTKPESRNIINSYYSQRISDAFPRCEVRNDEHRKAKKEKAQRGGSARDKSIAKVRKPFRRIENVRQVGRRTANVAIKDHGGEKRVVEKENSIMDEKAKSNQDGGVFDNEARSYLVQNVATNNSTFSNGLIDIPTHSHTPSLQESKKSDAGNPKAQAPASKIPRKLGLLAKGNPPLRASYSALKAPESPSAKLKENFRGNWLKKGNSSAASGKTDAKRTREEAGKFAESESSNACDTKGSETHKELQVFAYIFDKENVKAPTLQIEILAVEEQSIRNGDIVKGTNRVANGLESSKSGELPSRQKDEKREEDGRGGKERKENIQTKEDRSKSVTASERSEKDKRSTSFELLSHDTERDASSSTQGGVTTNADLFDGDLMDGKNNIQSDLQSAAEGNSNADRISTPKDEGLQKSATATAPSKRKLFKRSKSGKTSPIMTHKKIKNERESRNSDGGKITKTFHIADKDGTKKVPNTSLVNADTKNGSEGLKADAKVNEADVTGESSNMERNLAKIEHLEEPHSQASKDDLRQNSIALADCNFEESCRAGTAENRVPPMNTAVGEASARTPRKVPNHESLSCRFRVPTYRTKNGTPTSSSRASSDSNGKRKQGACRDGLLPRKFPPCKSREDKIPSKSKCGGKSMKDLKNAEQQEIGYGKEGEYIQKDSGEVITDIRDSRMPTPTVKCEKSVDPRCNGTVSKILCEGINTVEKEITHQEYDDVPEKLTNFSDSVRSSNDSTERDFSFTGDHKRFPDQGQELSTSKRKRSCADCAKPIKPSKICGEERASNNSISSLKQKAYSVLKTMLSKTKNVHKGFMCTKRTKGTQIYAPTIYEPNTLIEDCDKSHRSGRSLGSKMSESNESLILSISFGSSIFSNSSSPACDRL